MKKHIVIPLLLTIFTLLQLLYNQITYPLSNKYAFYYSTPYGWAVSITNYFTNTLIVQENPVYAYLIQRHTPDEILVNDPIEFDIKAVDENGKHVTVTNPQSIDLVSRRADDTATRGNLGINKITYSSDNSDGPDFGSQKFTTSYSAAELIKVQTTTAQYITNVVIIQYNHTNESFSLKTNIYTNTHCFISNNKLYSQTSQPFSVWNFDAAVPHFIYRDINVPLSFYLMTETNLNVWVSNDISDQYLFKNLFPARINVVNNDYLEVKDEGYAKIIANNTNRPSFSTNLIFFIGLKKDTSYNLSSKNYLDKLPHEISVTGDTFDEDVYFDVRKPENFNKEFSVENNTAEIEQAIELQDSERVDIFDNTIVQASVFNKDLRKIDGPFKKDVAITFPYNENDLFVDGDRICAEEEIKVYKLINNDWVIQTDVKLDTENNLITVYTKKLSVWAIGTSHTKIIRDVARVEVYPNPFLAYEGKYLHFINVPIDFEFLKIYTIAGRLVKEINSENSSVEINNIDDKALYNIKWNGNDVKDRGLAGGLYYYQIKQKDNIKMGKFVIIR